MTTFPVPGGATFMKAVNNLSDVASASAAAANIGALQVANNLSDVASKATALANIGGRGLMASTGINGFALQNATPTILTWNVPNDGQVHWAELFSILHVTSAETGGLVQFQYVAPFPGATTHFGQAFAAGLGTDTTGQPGNTFAVPVAPGSTVVLAQASALTVGAATLWAGIWGL